VERTDAFDALFFGHAARMVRLARLLGDDDPARHARGAHGERLEVVPDAVTAQAFGFAPPYLRSRSA
jgi:hypothetical protein